MIYERVDMIIEAEGLLKKLYLKLIEQAKLDAVQSRQLKSLVKPLPEKVGIIRKRRVIYRENRTLRLI